MKREYVYPQTIAEETMTITITMLCSSGGVTPPASHDTSSSNGGDPNDAI